MPIRLSLENIDIRTSAKRLIIPLSFIVPVCLLCFFYPNSFQSTWVSWKGRISYIFFLWLLFLEFILGWEKITQNDLGTLKKYRIVAVCIAAMLPTAFVIGEYFFGLEQAIANLGIQIGARLPPPDFAISFEYLVFIMMFAATIWLAFKFEGLKEFSISLFFLGVTGVFYMIDTFYPFGEFSVFQAFVQPTASFSALFLNWMGYTTVFSGYYSGTPVLFVSDSSMPPHTAGFGIGWPCAGVQSLFIYTFTVLLLLKKMGIPLAQKVVYFVIGAVGTYIMNILRIVSIFIIAMYQGMKAADAFHNFYGELFSITWIILYLMIIVFSRKLSLRLSLVKGKLQNFLSRRKNDYA